ncbi:sulfoxide reductase heme-binding subunit YedZ [Brevirhabdus pacifica]|uniref:Protein-methionine-sulfoxide reductase heme-binding subunit MsrQ n=1 Tax=Brevirhabdus pacifica TaxID=1267768 RepID=A0A1U7DME5_9RHOB|nr:sulfoxide reductase heme-binding subunit YedZ [Brevirhabdus pacifica]OWU74599.1 sulfite oxidase [Loktanella sp. 22II-4b]
MADGINRTARRIPVWPLYILGVVPALAEYALGLTGRLGVDPVKAIEQQLGLYALQLLIAGLAITPLRRYFGINLLRFRRAIGLLAFFYVCAHLATWLVLDIQLLWGQIWRDILKRPYITIGMAAFAMMIPLAVTSNNRVLKRMGAAAWRRLHRLTYLVALLGSVHFVMLVKGWQLEPLIYMAIIAALLLLRLDFRRMPLARGA